MKSQVLPQEKRLKIAISSQPEYFRFMYETDLNSFADVFEFKLHMGQTKEAFASLINFQADYNFFFRGEYVPDNVLESIKGVRIALSSEPFPRKFDNKNEFSFDSIQRYLFFRGIRNKPFDYVFHYDAASIPFMKWDNINVSGSFAFPVATSTYSQRNISQEWDIFFIGRSTQHREHYFGYLKHHYNFLHICHGIWGKPLVNYLCGAKICLNIHAENETSWEPRMQMMLACGAFVISEKITPNEYLRPGIDYIEITNPSELHEAVRYYLSHDAERAKIAKSGYERVRSVLNSEICFKNLITDINRARYEKFSCGPGKPILNFTADILTMLHRLKRRFS